jgi:18S rRNA (guanine1575-N7)-methyltransferase
LSFEYKFNVKKKRPEDTYSDIRDYYNKDRLLEYAYSKSMRRIQEKITKRVLELLDFKSNNKLILDAGCGPGFASFYLLQHGFNLVSLDLIKNFLNVYDMSEINPITGDMSYIPIKPDTFDGIISISALQWIYRDINKKLEKIRLIKLVKSFHFVLKRNGIIIIQFYPKSTNILEEIGSIFIKYAPFEGGYIIDNENSPKKRKVFLKLVKR